METRASFHDPRTYDSVTVSRGVLERLYAVYRAYWYDIGLVDAPTGFEKYAGLLDQEDHDTMEILCLRVEGDEDFWRATLPGPSD